MRRSVRSSVLAGTCACGAALAFAATDCADATQIVIDVRSDACPSAKKPASINATGIAVGTATTIENARDSAVRDGCEGDTDRVGTLTLYPSGDNDGEVTFRVVSGVEVPLDQCKARGYEGCITQHRTMRFEPRTTQTVLVKMSLSCLGKICPAGQTCDEGICVSSLVVPPGVDGGGGPEGAVPFDAPPSTDAPIDRVVEAGPRGCVPALCNGPGRKCAENVCEIDCAAAGSSFCQNKNVCPGDLDCRVLCNSPECTNVECKTLGTCVMECTGLQSCNGASRCEASRCDVICSGNQACSSFRLAGGNARIECPGKGGNDKVCSNVDCRADVCRLDCDGNGCSGFAKCCRPPASCVGDPWDETNASGCP